MTLDDHQLEPLLFLSRPGSDLPPSSPTSLLQPASSLSLSRPMADSITDKLASTSLQADVDPSKLDALSPEVISKQATSALAIWLLFSPATQAF